MMEPHHLKYYYIISSTSSIIQYNIYYTLNLSASQYHHPCLFGKTALQRLLHLFQILLYQKFYFFMLFSEDVFVLL